MRDQLQLPAELSRKKEEFCTICHAKSRTIASIALRKFMILKDGSLDARYYYTTTFGSLVVDGVYEILLDGMELEELDLAAGHKVHHLLILDDHYTWWRRGHSYLCRIIDILHMGFVDEALFGRGVLTRLPAIAREWRGHYDKRVHSSNIQAKVLAPAFLGKPEAHGYSVFLSIPESSPPMFRRARTAPASSSRSARVSFQSMQPSVMLCP